MVFLSTVIFMAEQGIALPNSIFDIASNRRFLAYGPPTSQELKPTINEYPGFTLSAGSGLDTPLLIIGTPLTPFQPLLMLQGDYDSAPNF